MSQEEKKQLLILEMKRVIEILESKKEVKVMKEVNGYLEIDRETSELKAKLREIRRDSLTFKKTIV
ncbi:hypothetical protein FKN04_09185 [Bacillus glycinifermentans]|uniref:hypothetical protein n=1 Tax=Bacillus glycinifermentans TaxID=1664069 RepID=UPI0015824C48|nr:hypothetical protein [Bacillus glycinifermentans]NUJ16766.1 hypothetical protein [Bacillus glycinifermentans]